MEQTELPPPTAAHEKHYSPILSFFLKLPEFRIQDKGPCFISLSHLHCMTRFARPPPGHFDAINPAGLTTAAADVATEIQGESTRRSHSSTFAHLATCEDALSSGTCTFCPFPDPKFYFSEYREEEASPEAEENCTYVFMGQRRWSGRLAADGAGEEEEARNGELGQIDRSD